MVSMSRAIESVLEVLRPGNSIRIIRRVPFGVSHIAKGESNCILANNLEAIIKKQ